MSMIKTIALWAVLFVLTGYSLLGTVSLIANVSFVNIFGEFDILLMLAGFSSILSTLIVCTKIISDKIEAFKQVETVHSESTDTKEGLTNQSSGL
ncbi:MAG: hypothetical protein JJU16_08855 [Alkalibacterium sp.]|nr:hypothetical protein [Alkalibacterium sp.]